MYFLRSFWTGANAYAPGHRAPTIKKIQSPMSHPKFVPLFVLILLNKINYPIPMSCLIFSLSNNQSNQSDIFRRNGILLSLKFGDPGRSQSRSPSSPAVVRDSQQLRDGSRGIPVSSHTAPPPGKLSRPAICQRGGGGFGKFSEGFVTPAVVRGRYPIKVVCRQSPGGCGNMTRHITEGRVGLPGPISLSSFFYSCVCVCDFVAPDLYAKCFGDFHGIYFTAMYNTLTTSFSLGGKRTPKSKQYFHLFGHQGTVPSVCEQL